MLEFPGYSRCMRRGWKWLAVLAGIVTLLVTVVLPNWPDWQVVAGFAVLAGCLGAIAVLIYRDSAERGRSGWGWLAACVLAAPVAFPVFAFVAVFTGYADGEGSSPGGPRPGGGTCWPPWP